MASQATTYCRICEPLCGLEATVEGGELLRLRPDRDHPLSKGFACPKGIAMTEVQNDPDRVVHPMRRRADGEFERVSWDEALSGIAARLNRIRREHGGDSIGWYFGNPATFSYSHPLWMNGFMAALGSPHFYSAGSQDTNNRFAASALMYGSPVLVPIPDLKRTDLHGATRSRVGGYRDVLGTFPAGVMAEEITTPGPGRLRALLVSAGNPALSVPGSAALDAALDELDLLVCIDLYVTDTGRKADYVLPATTFVEREDFPLPFLQNHLTPYVTWTEAVVPPRGEARQEWEIIDGLARRMGLGIGSFGPQRLAYRLGVRPSPRRMVDLLLRTGPSGDWFGLRRGGLSLRRLRANPHGIVLADHHRTGRLRRRIVHKDGRVRLDPPEIVAEAARLAADAGRPAGFPLRLIGMRELRSHNSWMHNAPGLMRGKRAHAARIHPADAAEHGILDGEPCRIVSAHGAIELTAHVTDEMTPGTVAVPHGWGHRGGWRVANAAGGANVNLLASPDPGDLEPLAGMARLNAVPVRIAAVAPAGPSPEP